MTRVAKHDRDVNLWEHICKTTTKTKTKLKLAYDYVVLGNLGNFGGAYICRLFGCV